MLYEFLKTNRVELIARCRAKAAKRDVPGALPASSEHGIPQFISQLIETLRLEQTAEAQAHRKSAGHGHPSLTLVPSDIPGTAAKHGVAMHRQGFSIDQVVHNYGDLCQALTELALELDTPISVDEFHTFNRCLDDAIADAVTAYAHDDNGPLPNALPGTPAQDMRNLIETAIHSFAAIREGHVGLKGTTSALHHKTLLGMRDLMDQPGLHAMVSPAVPR